MRARPTALIGVLVSVLFSAGVLARASSEEARSAPVWPGLPEDIRQELLVPLDNQELTHWTVPGYAVWAERRKSLGQPSPYAEYYLDHVLTPEERGQFLVSFSKLRHEGLWSLVKRVTWAAGAGGAILFEPAVPEVELKRKLESLDYGDWYLASDSERWGLRSRFAGAQLHFRGGKVINVHLDLNNPGDPKGGEPIGVLDQVASAINHYLDDLEYRTETHTVPALVKALKDQGCPVFGF